MIKKIKRLIIILLLIIILIIMVIIINSYNSYIKMKNEEQILYVEESLVELSEDEPIYEVLLSITKNYLIDIENKNIDSLFDILDAEYKQGNGINKENILNELDIISELNNVKILELYQKIISYDRYNKYFLKCKNNEKEINLIINIDFGNSTYSLEPTNNIREKMKEYENSNETNYTSIQENDYNLLEIN